MTNSHRLVSRNRIIGAVLIVALLVAMILSTKFLTPEELEATLPKPFNPQENAQALFTKAQTELPGSAAELGEVVPALQSDVESAAQQFNAVAPNESTYVFPVKTTATVTEASAQSLRLSVEGVPNATPILVPVGTAINGTVIRDVMGFRFADAPGQTDYQFVGDELKKLMQAAVSSSVSDPSSLEGKQVTVVGAISVPNTGTPPPAAKPVNVQPISVEAGSVTAGVVDSPQRSAEADSDVVLRAVDIAKTYGVTRALKGVNFEVRRGKVTVLFGENGAGKSTLMKIMSGVTTPTAGHLELDGQVVELTSTNDAVDRGISIIHQELNLCANLSVRDNVFIGRELRTKTGGIDYARERDITQELLHRLEEPISPSTLVADLRVGQQQVVEIARALAADARILIMDEPTSALSATEVEVLFKVIRELTSNGVAIVYISHHLEEALEIADYAVVFRDGELVATEEAKNIDLPWVVRQMVGREADYDFRDEPRDYGDVALSIQNVTVAEPDTGRVTVNNLSLDVRQGEIVCLYGLMGAGRTELMEALAGRDPISGGRVLLGGEDIAGRTIAERINMGLGLVPEDRQRDGLVQMMTVGQNMSLASLLSAVKSQFIHRRTESSNVDKQIKDVKVKTAGPGALITSLSGGNQQKVVIGKMLLTDPKVLLLDEPTRGIDVGAKGEIFALLFREARKGLAVLYVTSEIGEALTASHRIVVMSKGRIVKEFDPRTCTRDEVMASSGEHDTDYHHDEGAEPSVPSASAHTQPANGAHQ